METAFKVFRFVHGYVIIFEFKIFATSKFRALRDFAKKCYENQECEIRGCRKADYFLCSSTVYENVLLSLFQALVRNGKAESQLIEKFFLH